MLELFPQGFEEVERPGAVELAAYTDEAGEELLRRSFGAAVSSEVRPDWEERWREFHRSVRVGPLWIGPPWERAPEDAVAVVIDPGRAFGTGSHATTRLCLELLLELRRGSLVDLGSGSGVLAIAAAKLGFGPVLALDAEPAAVEATRANAAVNDVRLDVRLADALASLALPQAETAVANLSLEAVLALRPRLRCERAVTSGYLAAERPALPGFRRLARREAEGWAADLHERS